MTQMSKIIRINEYVNIQEVSINTVSVRVFDSFGQKYKCTYDDYYFWRNAGGIH
jgi:hypothetical protein